ncbi:MAG: hypothetical protein K2M97_07420 [Muribaculaceae bacterium]|nr:hypothetical protein [Muribaculaceae bacterium]
MAKISIDDTLFLTLISRGVTVFNRRVNGIYSNADLHRFVRQIMGGTCGIVNVTLRNGTQGWCHSSAMLLSA